MKAPIDMSMHKQSNICHGVIHINADVIELNEESRAKAREIYEAISSDGFIPFTKDEAHWLQRFNELLYKSNGAMS